MQAGISYKKVIFLIILMNPILSVVFDNTNIYYFYLLGPILALLLVLDAASNLGLFKASVYACIITVICASLAIVSGSPLGKINNHLFNYLCAVLLMLFMSKDYNMNFIYEMCRKHLFALKTVVIGINVLELFLLVNGMGYEYRYSWGGNFFHGTNSMPHTLGYLMLVIMLLVVLIIMIEQKKQFVFFSVVPFYGIFESGSRIALLLAVPIILILIDQVFTQKQKSLLFKGLFVLGLAGVALFLLRDKILESDLWSKIVTRQESGDSTAGRLYIWTDLLNQYFWNSNFVQLIFGQGDGSSYYYNSINPLVAASVWAHNDFVQILLGKGIAGLVVYIYAFGTCWLPVIKSNRNFYKYFTIGLILIAAICNGFYSYRDVTIAIPFFVLVAKFYDRVYEQNCDNKRLEIDCSVPKRYIVSEVGSQK